MENKRIFIVLTRTNTMLSKMIGIIKNDEYTHASISLSRNLDCMYSFGRKNKFNPFIGCFAKENLNEGVFGLQKKINGIVLEIEITPEQYDKAKILLNEFILNSNSYKYNYFGLICSLLNIEAYRNDRFLCSEFVYYILNECCAANLNKPRNLVRPQDLLNLKSRVLFKGNLKKDIEMLPIYKYVEI
ncbi:MAG: hypothetical protein K0R07_771 [Sedimentibacter sp.]|jgi:hypothetical protein|nr:hypothetical protein [Sedimentibacter sp.]